MQAKVLIIGGLGFFGRNLYLKLKSVNYKVIDIISDVDIDPNDSFKEVFRHKLFIGNIEDHSFLNKILPNYDVIFSLTGSLSPAESIKNPYKDLQSSLIGHLNILEICKLHKPIIIFPSSRLVYGKPEFLPVNEQHKLDPESIYAIHKITLENYYKMYENIYGIRVIIFRISNPIGPNQKFNSFNHGIINYFIDTAMKGKEIQIFGDGKQLRDYIHIDDLSNLFELSITNEQLWGETFNIGSGRGIAIIDVLSIIRKYLPEIKIKFKEWPSLDKLVETGDYVTDITKIKISSGWEPQISIEQGIVDTISFYKKNEKDKQ